MLIKHAWPSAPMERKRKKKEKKEGKTKYIIYIKSSLHDEYVGVQLLLSYVHAFPMLDLSHVSVYVDVGTQIVATPR